MTASSFSPIARADDEPLFKNLKQSTQRFSSDADAPIKEFHFSFTLSGSGKSEGSGSTVMVSRGHDGTAMLILSNEGFPLVYATDGLAIQCSEDVPGALVVSRNVWPEVILKASPTGIDCAVRLQSEKKNSNIQVDLGSILSYLSSAPAKEMSSQFDPVSRTLALTTKNTTSLWQLTSERRKNDFPLQACVIKTSDLVFQVSDIGTNSKSARKLLPFDQNAFNALKLPQSDGVVKVSPPKSSPPDPLVRAAGDSLLKLFSFDVGARQVAVANDIDRTAEALRVLAATNNSERVFSAIVGMLATFNLEVIDAVRNHARFRLHIDDHYDRTAIRQRIDAMLGADGVNYLAETLALIIKNREINDKARTIALELIGDTGLISDIGRFEADMNSPTLKGLLPAIRTKLGQKLRPEDADFLRNVCENNQIAIRTRLAALEAVLWNPDGTLPKSTLGILSEALQAKDSTLYANRYIRAVARNRFGFDLLLGDLQNKAGQLNKTEILMAFSSVEAPTSSQAHRLNEVVEAIALKSDVDVDVAVNVLSKECRDATIIALLDQVIKHPNEKHILAVLRLVSLAPDSRKFINQLESLFDKGSKRQQIMVLSSLRPQTGQDYKSAISLLEKSLNNPDSLIRAIGLRTIAGIKHEGGTGIDSLRNAVIKRALESTDSAESRIALFALEKITDGSFEIKGAPRDDQKWLAQGPSADMWWKDHLAKVRKQAADWSKSQKAM